MYLQPRIEILRKTFCMYAMLCGRWESGFPRETPAKLTSRALAPGKGGKKQLSVAQNGQRRF